MQQLETEKLRYPTGRHHYSAPLSSAALLQCLVEIETLPEKLSQQVAHLDEGQLDTPYRADGWTVRQVVHHLGDSHMNAFIRCKFALTEQGSVIKPYEEARWADMDDCRKMPVAPGLALLSGLHQRWLVLLRSLSAADLQRTYLHPQYNKTFTLEEAISLYAWHGKHHLAHITGLKKRNHWA